MSWDTNRLAELMAVRWMKYGRPGTGPLEDLVELIAEYLGVSAKEADDLLYHEGAAIHDPFVAALALVETHALMPPSRPDAIRALHNFGLHAAGDENLHARWALLDHILASGLRSQPGGTGRFSEDPGAVFAVVDDPNADPERRRYAKHFPWVIADLPFSAYGQSMQRYRPGDVVTISAVPPEYIVGVNGLPLPQFAAAARHWGRG